MPVWGPRRLRCPERLGALPAEHDQLDRACCQGGAMKCSITRCLWLHYCDPHALLLHVPVEPFSTRLRSPTRRRAERRQGSWGPFQVRVPCSDSPVTGSRCDDDPGVGEGRAILGGLGGFDSGTGWSPTVQEFGSSWLHRDRAFLGLFQILDAVRMSLYQETTDSGISRARPQRPSRSQRPFTVRFRQAPRSPALEPS